MLLIIYIQSMYFFILQYVQFNNFLEIYTDLIK